MVATSRPAPAALDRAMAVFEILDTPILEGTTVLAGRDGLARPVDRLNVMEVPDILAWAKPREFLLTTAYPLRERPESLAGLVADLDDAGLSGMGIKLGRYVDRLPDDMLATADERGFPIVHLPAAVSFDEVFNEVLTTLLNRQASRLERAERIHRAFLQIVLQGHGLREIVDNLAELIDGPAAIVARGGRVLATARCGEAGLAGAAQIEVRDDGRVRVDGHDLAAIHAPITAGPRLHGHVLALQGAGALTDDRLALESASTVAALAMTLHAEVQAVESKYQSDLMHDLLTGRATERGDVLRRAASFGWDLDRTMTAVVVRFDDPSDPVVPDEVHRRPPLASALRQAVLQRDPQAAIVRFGDEVVVLTRAFEDSRERGRADAFCRALVAAATRVTGDSASAGLSRPVADVAAIPRAYEEATTALRIARRIDGRGASAHFDDLGVHRLLALIEDTGELRRFAAETLGELAGEDESHRDLRRTLTVLLETNLNVAEAARRMHFHYNTLRYRIDKLERVLGPFTTDPRVRLDVQVALLILQMRHPDDDA